MSKSYAAPLSFTGSTRRFSAWSRGRSGASAWLAWTTVVLALPLVWIFIALWYVVIFGLFGLFTIPFRFLRRGQRKSLAVQQEQLALMHEQADRTALTPPVDQGS